MDRLISAVQRIGVFHERPSTADVLVTVMDENRIPDYVRLAHILRQAGINTELYTGDARIIGKQLKYADRQAIPVAVIVGSDEFEAGQVSIKNLRKIKEEKIEIADRKEWVKKKVGQRTVPMSDLITEVKSVLDQVQDFENR